MIGIIGMGNMGSAIAASLKEKYPLMVFDLFKKVEGYDNAQSIDEIKEKCDTVLIAIKPQVLDTVDIDLSGRLVLSIAAGYTLRKLHERTHSDRITRYMPNIAASVRKAVTAVAFSEGCTEDDRKLAFDVAGSFGSAFELAEKDFSAFIGVSGSGIAYAFEFMHALALGGCQAGLSYSQSAQIAADTMMSAACLFDSTKENPASLEAKVCSPGGTTIDGVAKLHRFGFDNAVMKAVGAAAKKSRDLESKD